MIMSEKKSIKKLLVEFENKEDFDTVFTFIWKHLNNQTLKTKGKINITSVD